MPSLLTTLLLTVVCGLYNWPPANSRTIFTPANLYTTHLTKTEPSQETSITEANWRRHPKITAIRNIVTSINAGLRKRTYKTARREFETCPNQYFTLRRIARDAKGVVAWYQEYFEYEDGSYDFHAYYDQAGRLRFVLVFARAANGTREQLRIYFDETGKRLWKIDKLLKGWGCPGCFSSYTDSDEGLAFDPAKEFANDKGCKEIKPKLKRQARRT